MMVRGRSRNLVSSETSQVLRLRVSTELLRSQVRTSKDTKML